MTEKNLPLSDNELMQLASRVGTPFHIYDGNAIRSNAREMLDAFSWSDGFINYFAVKALPNANILRILASEGFGADCSSLPELLLAEEAGIPGERIMFSSNDTPDDEFEKALEMGPSSTSTI